MAKNAVEEILDDFISAMNNFADAANRAATRMLDGLLAFLEAVRDWLVKAINNTIRYLVRFTKVFAQLSWALFRLALFYVPSLVLFYFDWWITGILWATFVTIIAFTYRNRR